MSGAAIVVAVASAAIAIAQSSWEDGIAILLIGLALIGVLRLALELV